MSLEQQLEECVWGRIDEREFARKIMLSKDLDESLMLEKLETVKEGIRCQIRKAVELHHSRLVEQAGALQGLDNIQSTISQEMSNLYSTSEELSRAFAKCYDDLTTTSSELERLYSLRRLLSAATKCEQLLKRLNSVSELVKRSEMACEIEAIIKENPSLKEISRMREIINVSAPELGKEIRREAVSQLRSSVESLNASLVSSAARALNNLSCYDEEVKCLINEKSSHLDAEFLKLGSSIEPSNKIISQLCHKVQVTLEQLSLLGDDSVTVFSKMLAKTILNRVPENAKYAKRIVQHFSTIIKSNSSSRLKAVEGAMKPYRTSLLSQSLSKMIASVNDSFDDPSKGFIHEKVCRVLKEEISSVSWDPDLKREMEVNAAKALNLMAQNIERHLVLDSALLQLSERISAVQRTNYDLINAAYVTNSIWPQFGKPLIAIAGQAREAIFSAAESSISTILFSMHQEKLTLRSPYVKELCDYLTVFRSHIVHLNPEFVSNDFISSFINNIVLTFMISASCLRPITTEDQQHLSNNLKYIAEFGLVPFKITSPLLEQVDEIVECICATPEEMENCSSVPFWFLVQLLISRCEKELLSPHVSAGWSLEQYIRWFARQTDVDRFSFLYSLVRTYTSSVISSNRTEYVSFYPSIMNLLQKVASDNHYFF